MSDQREASPQLAVAVHADDHALGPANAPLTLVEYADYECPDSRRAQPVVQALRRRFGPRLRFVFRHFPLRQVHEQAEHAAEVAEAAGAQGKYWEMHDRLYERQFALDDEYLIEYAGDLGLDAARVQRELEGHVHLPHVRADFKGGVQSGVKGTPTFFVNGVRFRGPWVEELLARALEQAGGAAS
jgi:formate-nitrite transporter family protein